MYRSVLVLLEKGFGRQLIEAKTVAFIHHTADFIIVLFHFPWKMKGFFGQLDEMAADRAANCCQLPGVRKVVVELLTNHE